MIASKPASSAMSSDGEILIAAAVAGVMTLAMVGAAIVGRLTPVELVRSTCFRVVGAGGILFTVLAAYAPLARWLRSPA